MHQIEAFILAGGASRRMGTDKAQLIIEGQTLVQRLAGMLLSLTSSITVVGRLLNEPKLKSVEDIYPRWGALGGLHAALAACRSEWAIVVACDLPFVTTDLFKLLLSLRGNYDAVVPLQMDGRPQPLAALYRADPCRQLAGELIEAQLRRPLDLLQVVNTRWVPFSDIRDLDQAEKFFVNINTPQDYYEATR